MPLCLTAAAYHTALILTFSHGEKGLLQGAAVSSPPDQQVRFASSSLRNGFIFEKTPLP